MKNEKRSLIRLIKSNTAKKDWKAVQYFRKELIKLQLKKRGY